MNKVYHYNGPVLRFGYVVEWDWDAYTTATTEKKALANLQSRYKKDHGYEQTARVELVEMFIKEEAIS